MNKFELAAKVSGKTGITKKNSEAAVNAMFAAITESLASGNNVQIVGFGTFEVKDRVGYTGHDPRTNEAIEIPAGRKSAFKASKVLKEAVAK